MNGVNTITAEGGLLGHITMGSHLVLRAAEKIKDTLDNYNRESVVRLNHLVVSHHGKVEWGSPETPKFTEAEVLHGVDMLSSRIGSFRRVAEGGGNEIWTAWDRILGRPIYKPAMVI